MQSRELLTGCKANSSKRRSLIQTQPTHPPSIENKRKKALDPNGPSANPRHSTRHDSCIASTVAAYYLSQNYCTAFLTGYPAPLCSWSRECSRHQEVCVDHKFHLSVVTPKNKICWNCKSRSSAGVWFPSEVTGVHHTDVSNWYRLVMYWRHWIHLIKNSQKSLQSRR